MKRSRYTEEQSAFALKQAELWTPVPEVCRKMGISDATFYAWRKKSGGFGPSELRRLKQLEEESQRLKRVVADRSLDKAMLQDVLAKNLRPPRKRQLVDDLQKRFGVSQRQACAVLGLSRASYHYRSVARDASALSMRIREITQVRVHYGYRRVHVLLQREGWQDNHKRVYRLYREQGLSLRLKRPKRNKAAKNRQPVSQGEFPNHIWGSMDFVSGAMFDGRRLRLLTIIDLFTRECLGIIVGQSLKGEDVKEASTRIARFRGHLKILKADNGSEFAGKVMDRWVYERQIAIDFSRPGKPTDNATVESFNGRLRQECLSENWPLSLTDAEQKIEVWRTFYNIVRPEWHLLKR